MASTTAQQRGAGIRSLPDAVLKHVLSLLPDQEAHLSLGGAGEFGSMAALSKGAAEQVCRLWRRLALELPLSCITLDFTRGVRSAELLGFVPAVLQALRGRSVLEVEIANATRTEPRELWQALGSGLLAGAHKLSLCHEIHGTNQVPPKTFELLAHCASLEELYLDADCLPDLDGTVAGSIAQALRGMPRLRQLDLFGVLLTRDLGSTIVGLGHIADMRLNLAFNTHYEDAWGLLVQLGGRLSCLGLVLDWMGLEPAGDPLPDEDEELEELRLPAGLLALTQLGRFDLQLLEFGGTRVEGLERMPLQRFDTNGLAPADVWRCTQLTELCFMADSQSLPPSGLTTLLPLRSLELCGLPDGFPMMLCGLSLLTSLTIERCDFSACRTALPPGVSRLSALQQLAIHNTCVTERQLAECMAHLDPLTSLTSLQLSMCGLTSLPAGHYLQGLCELAIDANAFQPRLAPIPSAVAEAAQLACLKVSLDAEPAELAAQWPHVQAVLIQLTKLKALGVSFLKGGAAPQPKAFSGAPDQNAEAFGRLRQRKQASGLTCFGMRDIGGER